MCIELPKKVLSVKEKRVKIKEEQGSCWVDTSMLDDDIKEGDYLITYQKVAVNKVAKKEIEEMVNLMSENPHHH